MESIRCEECGVRVKVRGTYVLESHIMDWLFQCDVVSEDIPKMLSVCTAPRLGRLQEWAGLPRCVSLSATITKRFFWSASAQEVQTAITEGEVIATAESEATEVYLLERTERPTVPANSAFERCFTAPERNPFMGWNPDARSIHAFRFTDVVLDDRFRGLFSRSGFIHGTGYLHSDELLRSLEPDARGSISVPFDGVAIIGCNVAFSNYFHWITQALPAINAAVSRPGQDARAAIVLPRLNRWQKDSIRLLGLGQAHTITIESVGGFHHFKCAEFSQILSGGAAFSNSETARSTYSYLRNAIDPPVMTRRKLYVARSDTSSRRMLNEDDVIDEVMRRGFEVVTPGDYSLTEQIRLFRTASVVVGSHGAGLTNIVFCDPGTAVYELLPSHYTNACFCNLAYVCGLKYWADAFESAGQGLPNLRHWVSNTALVAQRLDEVLALAGS